MKKFAAILVMLLVLSASAFAEGEYPIGGKPCSQGQPACFTNEGEIPIGGKTEDTTYQDVLDFLKSIFG